MTIFSNFQNGQPCCRVTLSRPLIPIVAPVFWNTGTLPWQPPSVSSNKMITGRYILKFWIFLCGDWYRSVVCCTYYHRPCSIRKFVDFRFVQIINSWCFTYSNKDSCTWIPSYLDWDLTAVAIQICMAEMVMFPSR